VTLDRSKMSNKFSAYQKKKHEWYLIRYSPLIPSGGLVHDHSIAVLSSLKLENV
jgi:hypothetical protein